MRCRFAHVSFGVAELTGVQRVEGPLEGASHWAEYDGALRSRGDLTIWFSPEVIAAGQPEKTGHRGGQQRYSDVVIETALTLRLVYGLPWRQTEGLFASILALMGVELDVPDHTTMSRRTCGLDVQLKRVPATGPVHLIVDATGLGIVGQGQWAAAKWGSRGRRGWKKLHLGVDEAGRILAAELTDCAVADATKLPDLLDQVVEPIHRLTADGGYDRRLVYEAAGARGAHVVIPPRKDAVISGETALAARDAHVRRIQEVGRRGWRAEAGQHQQARAENTFFRWKRIFGGRLRSRNEEAQQNEILTGCNVLNRMNELGVPDSQPVLP